MAIDCRMEHRERLAILGIRIAMASSEQMQDPVGRAYRRLFEYAADRGVAPSGHVMMIVREMGTPMILEAAIGVAADTPGEGNILASVLPEGDAVVALHVGRYEDIGPVYEAVFAHASQSGRRPNGAPYEVYLTSPETEPDPTKQRTEVVLPVA